MDLLRIVFVLVSLSGWVRAFPTHQHVNNLLGELKTLLEDLQNVTCAPGLDLYTPTNVNDGDLVAALECSMEELETMKAECNGTDPQNPAFEINQTIEIMSDFINQKTTTVSPAFSCEGQEKTDVHNFLDHTGQLVTMLNDMVNG